MCEAFSCLVTRGDKVYWKAGQDSHDEIISMFQAEDHNLLDDKAPPLNTFARVEIVPPNENYLNTNFSEWKFKIDENIVPFFITGDGTYEELCRQALLEWTKEVYTFNISEARNPIHPFKITAPIITKDHLCLLKQWDSVRDSVGNSVVNSVWNSVGDSVWNSVRNSVWNSVVNSVRDSVWVYMGSLFPILEWKYIDYNNPLFKKNIYPFQSAVDLWKQGLVSSFDGKLWRLHGGLEGKTLWKGTVDSI